MDQQRCFGLVTLPHTDTHTHTHTYAHARTDACCMLHESVPSTPVGTALGAQSSQKKNADLKSALSCRVIRNALHFAAEQHGLRLYLRRLRKAEGAHIHNATGAWHGQEEAHLGQGVIPGPQKVEHLVSSARRWGTGDRQHCNCTDLNRSTIRHTVILPEKTKGP